MTQVDRGAGDAPSDAELILQVRSGDREAFGALYTRHSAAARALARQYVGQPDAEDVVADAFGKLYEMLRRGKGPDSGFRTYLYTVVRHRAYDVSRGANRIRPAEHEEIEAALGRVASSEDPALQGFERSVVSRAYFALPERWREVLWYCLVDDLKPAQVAPVLGLTPNGVSALLYRAKDALRDGYLQQHLTHAPSDTCRAVNPHLGGYVRDSLSRREKSRIEAHLATCGTCSALVLELADVAHGMKCVVAPLVLGAAGLALVGSAIPVGTGLAAAVKAASSAAGMAGAASGGGAVGASGGMAVGAGAGTSIATGVGSTAAAGSTAAVGASAGAAAGAGVSAGGAVAGVAGATAGATAAGVVGASGAAATSGAAGAGMITVAAVGVVAALQLMGPQADTERDTGPVVAASPESKSSAGATAPPSSAPGGTPEAAPTEEDTTDPTNLAPLADESLGLSFADDAGPLEPRRAQDLVLELVNAGETTKTGTSVRLTLPEGMTAAVQGGPSGTGRGAALGLPGTVVDDPDAGTGVGLGETDGGAGTGTAPEGATPSAGTEPPGAPSPGSSPVPGAASAAPSSSPSGTVRTVCTPDSGPGTVSCDVGRLDAGGTREIQVTVRADAGGSYPITAELVADDITSRSIELPAREVTPYGAELTVQTDATELRSPGTGVLPVTIGNTGDRTATPGWSLSVTLPEGVRPASAQEALACTEGELHTWSCAPLASAELDAGAWRDLPLALAAVPSSTRAAVEPARGTASVVPAGAERARSARAQVEVTSAFAGAEQGVGELTAQCAEKGGRGSAKSEVTGTYTNTAAKKVSVALETARGRTEKPTAIAPGERATLRRSEGLRVAPGKAFWVLTRTIEGVTYEHRVPAGRHGAADCYHPAWDTKAKAATVNAAGSVGVRGTLLNETDEPMRVTMVVQAKPGRLTSSERTVAPGESRTFEVVTGQDRLPPGSVTFHPSRWTVDDDGDVPAQEARPPTGPTAGYGRAVIAPSYTAEPRTLTGLCTYDAERDVSIGTLPIPVDNTASTLPVTFRLGDASRTIAGGETGVVEVSVPWGTRTLPLTTDSGRELGPVDVTFESCAKVSWPGSTIEARVEAQCVDGAPRVVADVRNTGGTAWTGRLARPYSGREGAEADVPAHGSARLVLDGPVDLAADQDVALRLSREVEGARHTVERNHRVGPVACEPVASCTDGSGAANWFAEFFGGGCGGSGTPAPDEEPFTSEQPHGTGEPLTGEDSFAPEAPDATSSGGPGTFGGSEPTGEPSGEPEPSGSWTPEPDQTMP